MKQTGVIWEPQYDDSLLTLRLRVIGLLRQLDEWERRARGYEAAIAQTCDAKTSDAIYRHMEESGAINREDN